MLPAAWIYNLVDAMPGSSRNLERPVVLTSRSRGIRETNNTKSEHDQQAQQLPLLHKMTDSLTRTGHKAAAVVMLFEKDHLFGSEPTNANAGIVEKLDGRTSHFTYVRQR